jgi:hypothetical protein
MANWLDRSGSPETFAPLLRRRPAPGVPAKRVAYQIAFGDQTVPNPTSATIVRGGGLLDVTTFYRNDRTPTAGGDPHGFLLDPRITGRNLGQRQVVELLDSEGASIIDPDGGSNVFETPVTGPLSLERLNFALAPATGEPPAETALPAIRLRVAPRSVRAGRRARLRFRVTTKDGGRQRAVRRALVRVGGRRARTNRRGQAGLTVRFRRGGSRAAPPPVARLTDGPTHPTDRRRLPRRVDGARAAPARGHVGARRGPAGVPAPRMASALLGVAPSDARPGV